MVSFCHLSSIICPLSPVIYHLSSVTGHLSSVLCPLSFAIFICYLSSWLRSSTGLQSSIIDGSMIGGERDGEDRAGNQLVALDHGPPLGRGDGKDADFRQIQDRVELMDAEHAEVADRERAAGELLGRKLLGTGRDSQGLALPADLRQSQGVGPVQHRDNQALIQGDGDADIDL